MALKIESIYTIKEENGGHIYVMSPNKEEVADAYLLKIVGTSLREEFESKVKDKLRNLPDELRSVPSSQNFLESIYEWVELLGYEFTSVAEQISFNGLKYSYYRLTVLIDTHEIVLRDSDNHTISCPLLIQLNKILKQYCIEGNSFLEEKQGE